MLFQPERARCRYGQEANIVTNVVVEKAPAGPGHKAGTKKVFVNFRDLESELRAAQTKQARQEMYLAFTKLLKPLHITVPQYIHAVFGPVRAVSLTSIRHPASLISIKPPPPAPGKPPPSQEPLRRQEGLPLLPERHAWLRAAAGAISRLERACVAGVHPLGPVRSLRPL